LSVKRRLEENEGRIGNFYGLLYVEKKTGGKKKYLKATHKSERRFQAIEHWIYTIPTATVVFPSQAWSTWMDISGFQCGESG